MLSLSNPNASAEACELYKFIQGCKRPLIAQHDFITSGVRYFGDVADVIGMQPAIWGCDFSFSYLGENPNNYHHCGPMNFLEPGAGTTRWPHNPTVHFSPKSQLAPHEINPHTMRMGIVERCRQMHEQGIIVTMMWHQPYPLFGDSATDGQLWVGNKKLSEQEWLDVVTPGTPAYAAWEKQADKIAGYLAILRDEKIPVLWRPYHEMNGVWFWWGNRPGCEAGFPRLWRQMYERFTRLHGLDNLIWVWNANAPRMRPNDEAYDYELFYPGSDCVDVLASDVYHNDYKQSHHDDLLKLAAGKPIALGEVGHLPTPEILKTQTDWKWIMPWGGLLFRHNSDESIRATYAMCQGK